MHDAHPPSQPNEIRITLLIRLLSHLRPAHGKDTGASFQRTHPGSTMWIESAYSSSASRLNDNNPDTLGEQPYHLNTSMDSKPEVDVASRPSSGNIDVGSVRQESRFWSWIRTLSIETGGIQRVTEEERQQNTTHVWNACTFW